MNEQQATIFDKALQSDNLRAVAAIADLFNELGEETIANTLRQRVEQLQYSTEYGFGLDYAKVQQKLNDLKIVQPALTVDGQWGPKSKAALVLYQKSKGLSADGVPGPITLGSLGITDAGQTAASTMGQVTPASASADAAAYTVAKKAGAEMGYTEKEIQYVMSVARGEGNYGNGWGHPSAKTIEESKGFGITGYEGVGSNNWGAVQGTGSAGSFPHVDHDAKGKAYLGHYKKYLTPEEGFKDMARTILGGGPIRKAIGAAEIKTAIAKGNLHDAVYAQHANGYFELAPDKYLATVVKNYNTIMAGIGWPKVLDQFGITPVKAAAGIGGIVLGLSAVAAFLFRKQLGLVT